MKPDEIIEKFIFEGKEFTRICRKYEKPRIFDSNGKELIGGRTAPCRPNHMPSGRPCWPPSPAGGR